MNKNFLALLTSATILCGINSSFSQSERTLDNEDNDEVRTCFNKKRRNHC